MSLARLQIYVAAHRLDIDPSRDLLEAIGKQITNGSIEATPELLEILEEIEKEVIKEKEPKK
jgi:hypothetical protein